MPLFNVSRLNKKKEFPLEFSYMGLLASNCVFSLLTEMSRVAAYQSRE